MMMTGMITAMAMIIKVAMVTSPITATGPIAAVFSLANLDTIFLLPEKGGRSYSW